MGSDECLNLETPFSLVGDQFPQKSRARESWQQCYLNLFSERWQETQSPGHDGWGLAAEKRQNGDGIGLSQG